jgi:protein gp37
VEPGLGPVSFRWLGKIKQGLNTEYDGLKKLDWVICRGETGPYARPMHPDWVRSIRDQAVAAGVPFFFNSWGEWAPGSDYRKKILCVYNDGRTVKFTKEAILRGEFLSKTPHNQCNPTLMSRVGKKAACRLLDGQTWDEVPGVAKEIK